jgi:hypothetical protein
LSLDPAPPGIPDETDNLGAVVAFAVCFAGIYKENYFRLL